MRVFLKITGLLLFLIAMPQEVLAIHNVKIGIIQDGPYWYNAPLINQVKKELSKINDGQFGLEYPAEYNLNGQYDFEKIRQQVKELSNNKELDVIIAFGMASSFLFSELDPLPVPVVALDYILPAGMGMLSPKTYKPLNPNWTTSFDPAYVDQTLTIFPKLVTSNHFTLFCPQAMCGFDPKIPTLIESFVENPNVTVKVEIVSPENYAEKIENLQNSFVVVEALKGFSDSQMEDFFKRLRDRKILTFTVDGMNGIEKGALVSIHDYDTERMGRNVALKLFDILNGTPPSQIPVFDFKTAELIFNRETARQLDYEIPLEFIDEARLFGLKETHPKLLFDDAILLSLDNNPDIKAQAMVKNQSLLQVDITERGFYPQVSSGLSHRRLNTDQADALGGPRGETRFDLTLQQKLFDRELWKSIESAEAAQEVEQENLELINQDITLQVALAYIDNLQGEELVEIQRNYLSIIRKNQNLADLKFKLRETGKSDVLRLSIELDNARIDLMNAKESRYRAQVRLNNLLNLSRETRHQFESGNFSAEEYLKRSSRFSKFLSTADQLKIFRDYFDEQAQSNSPDLKVLQTTLNRARVEKEGAQSRFYPTASVEAGYFNQFQDETQSLSPIQRQAFNDRFGEGWQAQFKLQVPLFEGGARFKKVEQANVRILEIQSRITSLKNSISESARSGLFNVFRSRRNLEFAFRNVVSSLENLILAEVAYLEGDLPVIDLLDSQSRLILSKTNAVRTRYQFFKDLFSLFRFVGRYDLIKKFNSKEEVGIFLNDVSQFFEKHSTAVTRPERKGITQ